MSAEKYDVIVVGLGAMGSATAFHLAKKGQKVLGLDSFGRRHKFGSSHGTSRIIREAYFEDPNYVPLVKRAYQLWRELEAETGAELLMITGGLTAGKPDSEFVSGALASSKLYNLPYEYLSAAEVGARFPAFTLTENLVAIYEKNAGILFPESCVVAHLDQAIRYGAALHHEEQVLNWSSSNNSVRVETSRDSYEAARLIITTGPWASELLGDLGLPLKVQRIVNVHFEPDNPERFQPGTCPVYLLEVPEGQYYGFPMLPGEGLKIGRHDIGEVCTPQTINREVDPTEIEMLRAVLDRYMPGGTSAVKWSLTCMYTNTPDRNFILDRHPQHSNVVFGCGFSGHGFKFASAIGEVLAELSSEGRTQHPVDFLAAARFVSQA